MTLARTNAFLSGVVCLLLGGLIALVLLGGELPFLPETESSEPEGEVHSLLVDTFPAERLDSFEIRRIYTGVTRAKRSLDLGFARSGRIEKILAEKGDAVSEGDVLAELDTNRLEVQKEAIEDAIDERESSPRGGPPAPGTSETDLKMVEIDLDDSVLKAPFDGRIASRMASEGAMASPGHPVFRIVQRDELEAWIGVPVDVAERLYEGEIHTLDIGGEEVVAPISSILPEVDMTTRTRTVVFTLDEEDSRKRLPGVTVRLVITRTIEQTGFWVPLSALTRETRGLWSVYTAEKDEENARRIGRHYVEVLHVEGDMAWIRGTIEEGTKIVSSGTYRVVPGQKVHLAGEEPVSEPEPDPQPEPESEREPEPPPVPPANAGSDATPEDKGEQGQDPEAAGDGEEGPGESADEGEGEEEASPGEERQ